MLSVKHKILYKGWLKSSYEEIISAVDDFFDQWDPNTVTLMQEVCEPQGKVC